jgi:hypothetical protein
MTNFHKTAIGVYFERIFRQSFFGNKPLQYI